MRFVAVAVIAASCLLAGEYSNRRAPGFALPDTEYARYYDLQDFRGRVVVLDIIQTNCPHCQVFARTLERIKTKYGAKIQVLSVVLPPDNQTTVRKFIADNGITSPVLFDMGQMTASYFSAKPDKDHVDVPHVFVIDRTGMIRDDYAWSEDNKAVFEGDGLVPIIERLIREETN